MPIYEYPCPTCEKTHEVWQKITEDALTECPECGGPVERIISQTSFALKGSGWYATDYKGGPKSAGSTGSSTPEASSADTKSPESKPAASSESSGSSGDSGGSSSPSDGSNHSKGS